MSNGDFVRWFAEELLSEPELIRKTILEILPQGHGGGFNADLLDTLHAEEIIEKASTRGYLLTRKLLGTIAGGGGGMSKHGNEYHTPDFHPTDSDLVPATDGLFLGENTTPRRWDGSRVINLDASKIASGVLSESRGGLGKALTPTWTNEYTLHYRTFPPPAGWRMIPKWGRNLNMMPAYFDSSDVSVGTEETTIYSINDSPSKWKTYVPSFSADYRFTDLGGGNPTCTLRMYFTKDGGVNWRALNYVKFQGVDLYRHPVALVRALYDYSDFLEFASGVQSGDYVQWEVRAVLDVAGTVVFSDRSFSGIYAEAI